LASTACACLWFKSRYIPRVLAAFGVISSAFCVGYTFIFYIFPDFDKTVNLAWFDMPMGLFDIALSFWLLFVGLKPLAAAKA
jgi:glucan phosphoethanolaminetransferase (alkaline phosphatase superfamily)